MADEIGLQKNDIHRVAEPPPDLDEFEADIMASYALIRSVLTARGCVHCCVTCAGSLAEMGEVLVVRVLQRLSQPIRPTK